MSEDQPLKCDSCGKPESEQEEIMASSGDIWLCEACYAQLWKDLEEAKK